MWLRVTLSSLLFLILAQGSILAGTSWEFGVARRQGEASTPFSTHELGWEFGVAALRDLGHGLGVGPSVRMAQSPMRIENFHFDLALGDQISLGYEGPPRRSIELALALRGHPERGNGSYATARIGGVLTSRGDVYELYTAYPYTQVYRERVDNESGLTFDVMFGVGFGYCLPKLGPVIPALTAEYVIPMPHVFDYSAFRFVLEWQ